MYLCLRKQGYQNADVIVLVDTLDLGSSAARCAGSIPVIRTKNEAPFSGAFFMGKSCDGLALNMITYLWSNKDILDLAFCDL